MELFAALLQHGSHFFQHADARYVGCVSLVVFISLDIMLCAKQSAKQKCCADVLCRCVEKMCCAEVLSRCVEQKCCADVLSRCVVQMC